MRLMRGCATLRAMAFLWEWRANFAFVTQVFFAPAMTHVTPFMLSFTDMSYVFGALCAAFLLVRSRGSLPRMSMPLLWGLSLAMAVLFALYGLLITDVNDIASVNFATNAMFLVGGTLFGAYLAYVIPLWLRVCAAHDPEEIVWTILLAGALGSVLVWFLGDMGPARLLVASDSMLLLGTYMLGRAVAAAQESDGEQKLPVRLFAACFLMAFAFAIAISSAESRGASSSYATGTFFAPVLIGMRLLAGASRAYGIFAFEHGRAHYHRRGHVCVVFRG